MESGGSATDAALLMGEDQSYAEFRHGLMEFKKAGFYIIRRPDINLIVRAGRLAHAGVHAHCDQASFELSIKRIPVFIDRGTYVYTSDIRKRNLFRSTKAHNTISINRAEQNRPIGQVFGLIDDTQTKVQRIHNEEIIVKLKGFTLRCL